MTMWRLYSCHVVGYMDKVIYNHVEGHADKIYSKRHDDDPILFLISYF
jgi:hypothetical protein